MLHHHVPAPVTRAQATRAIHADWIYTGERVVSCAPAGAGQSCLVGSGECFTDAVFGPSLIFGGESVMVTRAGRRYTVRQTTPDEFAVYAGDCGND